MRPYQLDAPSGPWIDLDTVQAIFPPVFEDRMGSGGFFVDLSWRHAFQDAPDVRHYKCPSVRAERPLPPGSPQGAVSYGLRPELDEHGEIKLLARVRREVYEPFLKAWKGEPENVCGNCDTAMPAGCGGAFLSDGRACKLFLRAEALEPKPTPEPKTGLTASFVSQVSNGDKVEVVVEYRPGGWVVFINGGILSDGRDDAHFITFTEACAFAMNEAVINFRECSD